MSETTFGLLFALFSVLLTGVLLLISRFNQRLTDSSSTNQQWIWSSQLDRTGRWLLVVGVILMLIGFLIGDTRFIPIAVPAHISGGSMLGGFFCLVLAVPFISCALLWRLQLRYGLRQLAMNIKQRLPDPPTKHTLYSVVRFAGQLCVVMVAVGWGLLRVIATSGALDGEEPDRGIGDFFNYRTNKFDHGLDPAGMYVEDID
jgi:hypothetical protein